LKKDEEKKLFYKELPRKMFFCNRFPSGKRISKIGNDCHRVRGFQAERITKKGKTRAYLLLPSGKGFLK
jgi:hypothetical protein